MTTIAWDGKSVAADSQCTYGSYISPENFKKLIKRGDVVYACTGTGALFKPLIEWYYAGADPNTCPHLGKEGGAALLVFRGGKSLVLKTDMPYPDELHAPDAWGSGADFAIGAMKAGADAQRAVEIAIECDPYTGGKVMCFELDGKR